MRFFRAAALFALSLGLVVAASACGNSSSGGAASGAAVYAPASTTIFITVDSDTDGAQWQALDELLAKFPDGEGLIDKALSDFGSKGDVDIRDSVGDELAVAVLDVDGDDAVLLTQPSDVEKFKQVVGSSEEPGFAEELGDGWWAAAESQELLDRFNDARKSGDSLADDDAYRDATDDLFDDALATVYANTRSLEHSDVGYQGLPGTAGAAAKCLGGDDSDGGLVALAVRAEDGGLRIGGDVASAVLPVGGEGAAGLDEFFRSGALAFVATSGLGDALRDTVKCLSAADPNVAQTLAQIQIGLGITIDGDIADLFDDATGVAVYNPTVTADNTSPAPVVVVATEVSDEDAALALIDGLIERAGGLMGMMGGETSISTAAAGIAGVDARVVFDDGEPVLYYATVDGKLVVSNSKPAFEALRSGSSLADDPVYTSGRDAAGVSDDAAAIVYVNVGAVAGLGLAGIPNPADLDAPGAPDVLGNVEPLKSLFFWSDDPGDDSLSFEGFLQID